MISVASLRQHVAGIPTDRLRREYILRRQVPGGLASRLVLRAVRDELVARGVRS